MRTIGIGRQHAGDYINTTKQTGHSNTLLMSTHHDLMNPINDTNLSSTETDIDLTESNFTRNNKDKILHDTIFMSEDLQSKIKVVERHQSKLYLFLVHSGRYC